MLEGEFVAKIVRTACPLNCWDTCTWLVKAEKGIAREISGDPENPYTRGFVCPKAQYQLQRSLDPNRPLNPMKRSGSHWEPISWEEAFDLFASKIEEAISRYGPQSIFYYSDSGSMGLLKSLGLRFFRSLGGITEPLGSLCWAAGLKAQEYDFGFQIAHAPEDILNSRFIIIWGRNPAVTNVHFVPFITRAKEKGATVVLIDPVKSQTASLVHEVITPRPGTDGALALAMINHILKKGIEDLSFVAAFTAGFGRFVEHVEKYTPQWAEKVTGVQSDIIVGLARRIAKNKPASILMGYGLQRYYNGGNTVRAIDALSAVTGNIGLEGGGANYANRWIANHLASLVPEPAAGVRTRFVLKAKLEDVATLKNPPVKMIVVVGANPVNQAPNSPAVQRAFSAIPFKVTLDLRWTETCKLSDLFFPVASSLECEDLYFCSWHPYIVYGEKAMEPRGQALPEHIIWREVAKRLGFGKDFERTPEEWIDIALRPLHRYGLNAEAIKGQAVRFPTVPKVPYSDGRFFTSSGKFEFYSHMALRETGYPMASYIPRQVLARSHNLQKRDSSELELSDVTDYPLVLISPRTVQHLHSQFYERVLSDKGLPVAYVNKSVLRRYGTQDGQEVFLESPYGRMIVELKESDKIGEGLVLVYEGGSVLEGKGTNLLTPSGETDMGHGARYYDCLVRIRPKST